MLLILLLVVTRCCYVIVVADAGFFVIFDGNMIRCRASQLRRHTHYLLPSLSPIIAYLSSLITPSPSSPPNVIPLIAAVISAFIISSSFCLCALRRHCRCRHIRCFHATPLSPHAAIHLLALLFIRYFRHTALRRRRCRCCLPPLRYAEMPRRHAFTPLRHYARRVTSKSVDAGRGIRHGC